LIVTATQGPQSKHEAVYRFKEHFYGEGTLDVLPQKFQLEILENTISEQAITACEKLPLKAFEMRIIWDNCIPG